MADKIDVYRGARKVGEIRVYPDWGAYMAEGIVGIAMWIAIMLLFGALILLWWLLKVVVRLTAAYPKVMLPLLAMAGVLAVLLGLVRVPLPHRGYAYRGVTSAATTAPAATVAPAAGASVSRAAGADAVAPERAATTATARCTVRGDGLRLRLGTSASYGVLERFADGNILAATARNAAGDWIAVRTGSGREGWVGADYLRCDQAPMSLPVGAPRFAPADLSGYHVVNVRVDDMLTVRSAAGADKPLVGAIPPNGAGIRVTGAGVKVGAYDWLPISYNNVSGWVNSHFLER